MLHHGTDDQGPTCASNKVNLQSLNKWETWSPNPLWGCFLGPLLLSTIVSVKISAGNSLTPGGAGKVILMKSYDEVWAGLMGQMRDAKEFRS